MLLICSRLIHWKRGKYIYYKFRRTRIRNKFRFNMVIKYICKLILYINIYCSFNENAYNIFYIHEITIKIEKCYKFLLEEIYNIVYTHGSQRNKAVNPAYMLLLKDLNKHHFTIVLPEPIFDLQIYFFVKRG